MVQSPPDELLRLVFNNTTDSIFLLAVEGVDQYRVLAVNARYLKTTNSRAEQVVGKRIDQLYAGASLRYLYTQYQAAIDQGAPLRYETRTDPSSSETYIDTVLVPITEAGETCYLVGVSRDITRSISERKALEEEKRRAENYLNIAEALIVAVDRDANITLLNRKGYQLVGYPEGSLEGRNWCDLFIAEERRQKFRESFKDALERRDISRTVNYIQAADGRTLLISWANSIIFDKAGQPAGMLSSGEDITNRHRAEKALIASQRMLAAEEVVSAVAHDFNNALQGILGNIELALISVTDSQARERLTNATRLAGEAAARIRVLQRNGAAPDEDSQQRREIELNSLLSELVDVTRHLWHDDAGRQGKRITVETNLPEQSILVTGNPDELRTVVTNIIKNGVEAIQSEGTVTVSATRQNGEAVVLVTDDGMGMNAETSARIFQPFFSTRGLETGRGLGMSASHAIVRSHGGELSVRDTGPGEGTTIEIRIPALRLAEPVTTGADTVDHHILWVDDDPDVLRLAAGYMQILGFRGDTAEGGRRALDKLANANFSVVVTDIGMPGMNGFELAANIRARGSDIPIIGLTGWGDQVESSADERKPFRQILGKPIRLAELKTVLAQLDGNPSS
ncbi:MAG: PAS domain S-box protein [Pseudomonadota bacterium]